MNQRLVYRDDESNSCLFLLQKATMKESEPKEAGKAPITYRPTGNRNNIEYQIFIPLFIC